MLPKKKKEKEYYDVNYQTQPNYDQTDHLSRLCNALIEGINNANRMPKLILFLDLDILEYVTSEIIAYKRYSMAFCGNQKILESLER